MACVVAQHLQKFVALVFSLFSRAIVFFSLDGVIAGAYNYTINITLYDDTSSVPFNAQITNLTLAAGITNFSAVAGGHSSTVPTQSGAPCNSIFPRFPRFSSCFFPDFFLIFFLSAVCEPFKTLNFQLAGPNVIYSLNKLYLYGTAASSYKVSLP